MIRTSIGKQVYAEALYQNYVKNFHGSSHRSREVNEKYLLDIIKDLSIRKKIRSQERINSIDN